VNALPADVVRLGPMFAAGLCATLVAMFVVRVFGSRDSDKGLVARHKSNKHILDFGATAINDDKTYKKSVDEYADLFESHGGHGDVDERKGKYMTIVNHYYDFVTDFFEWGWSHSFHFARQFIGEAFQASLARHEHYLAVRLGLEPGMNVIDVGCGIGGPMRNIARVSGAKIVGVNNNQYQIDRGTIQNKQFGLGDQCSFIRTDFMNLPKNVKYDAAYTIEACVHAPVRRDVFAEVYEVLKPGALFAGYEWCMTDKYNPKDPRHVQIKHDIAIGDGLPDIATIAEVKKAVTDAGFELIDYKDLAPVDAQNPISWYDPLEGRLTWNQFHVTPFGLLCTYYTLKTLEFLHLVPKGVSKTQRILIQARNGLVIGGQEELFTPMWFFLARKPASAAKGRK